MFGRKECGFWKKKTKEHEDELSKPKFCPLHAKVTQKIGKTNPKKLQFLQLAFSGILGSVGEARRKRLPSIYVVPHPRVMCTIDRAHQQASFHAQFEQECTVD